MQVAAAAPVRLGTGGVKPLFRPEVASAQQADWLGSVRLLQPPSLGWLTVAALAAAVGCATFLATASYTRKATLPGLLMPAAGVVRLSAPQPGVVVQRLIQEGQAVRQGEALFVLRTPQGALLEDAQTEVRRSLAERRAALQHTAKLQQQLTNTRLQALERRLKAQQAELTQLDAEVAAQQQRLALARESLERQRALLAQQFLSPAQVQSKEEEVLAVQAQLQALRRQRATLERERAELEGERAGLPVQGAQQQSEALHSLAVLARESAEQDPARQFVVQAPSDGVVGTVAAQAGQSVLEGSALAVLLPAKSEPLRAELLAPASAVGLLRPGQVVWLRYEAFAYQRHGMHQGRVLSVSTLPLSAQDVAAMPLPAAAADAQARAAGELGARYRVQVQLDDDPGPAMPQPLRPGMALMADVAIDKRRLVEWMFAPLLGVAGRL